jgi:hypothetical protein
MSDHTPVPDTSEPWADGGDPEIVDDDLDPTIDLTGLPPVFNTHPEG